MRTSESIKEIATALAKAQAAMQGATKDARNPAFKSTYATLASVIEAARGPLTENGIAYIQAPSLDEHGLSVTTTLFHSSGEWISNTLTLPLSKRDAHGIGSATTYCCRYSLMALLGLPPVDDDGNAAIGDDPNGRRRTVHVERKEAPLHDPLPPDLAGPSDKSAYAARKEGKYPVLQASIDACASTEDAMRWWTPENRMTLKGLPESWRNELIERWKATLANQIGQECNSMAEVEHWKREIRPLMDGLGDQRFSEFLGSLAVGVADQVIANFERMQPLEAAE